MAKITSLHDVFVEELKDIYSAEKQLTKALPKMAKAASVPELRDAFQSHLEETIEQVARLEKIGQMLGKKLSGKTCVAMEGLIEEGKELMEEDYGDSHLLDTLLIVAAQKVEHYEIAAYGSVRTLAEALELTDIAALLEQTLEEEATADAKLTDISVEQVLPLGAEGAREDSEDAETTARSTPRSGSKSGRNARAAR